MSGCAKGGKRQAVFREDVKFSTVRSHQRSRGLWQRFANSQHLFTNPACTLEAPAELMNRPQLDPTPNPADHNPIVGWGLDIFVL